MSVRLLDDRAGPSPQRVVAMQLERLEQQISEQQQLAVVLALREPERQQQCQRLPEL